MLKENLEKVEENIQAACDRAGRKRDEVTLIAVSKTKPVEMLQEDTDFLRKLYRRNLWGCIYFKEQYFRSS